VSVSECLKSRYLNFNQVSVSTTSIKVSRVEVSFERPLEKFERRFRFLKRPKNHWTCVFYFSFSSLERILKINFLTALDLGADVEQPFDCLVIQNGKAMRSMRRSMNWTLEDNRVRGLFF